jgi:hypothetical protein
MRKQLISALAVALGLLGVAPLALAGGDACCEASGCCTKKVCTPTTDTWTRIRPGWGMACEDFCRVPCCFGLGGLFGGKGCCSSGCEKDCCGKVKPRRVLIIKLRKEDHIVPRCTVTEVPACATSCSTSCSVSCCQGQPGTVSAPVNAPVYAPAAPAPGPAMTMPQAGTYQPQYMVVPPAVPPAAMPRGK